MTDTRCPLCDLDEKDGLWANEDCLVVLAQVAGVGTICRVVWRDHVREMSDLAPTERRAFMDTVFAVEAVLRQQAWPTKMNLASLGNLVPHLHWHVIPRYEDDAYFPDAIWGAARRPGAQHLLNEDLVRAALYEALGQSRKSRL